MIPTGAPPSTHNGALPPIGFVVPRYGIEILGGAERHIRGWAEQLHARGYPVEVFTTCTNDILAWNDYYPPGESQINGVLVRRFPADPFDVGQFHRTSEKAIAGKPVPFDEQLQFMRQNINSQALYRHLRDRQEEFACFIFAPYLFGTTYWGVQAVPDKAVLLPCLHDEPFARFAIVRELLETVRGITFSTEVERRFAREQLGLRNPNTAIVAYGFDPATPPGDAARFRARRNLPPELLLYSGRFEEGKNVPLLLDYFTRYKAERPGRLVLALTGSGDVVPPARPDVITLGFLDEAELRDAYAAATIFCQPSLNESFSIVIMEAWLQAVPVLVHAGCAVTADHVARSGGGWAFGSYEEFRAALDHALADASGRAARGQAGRAYVLREYSWDAVIGRLLDALQRFTRPLALRDQLARRGVRRALAFTPERFDERFAQVVARAEADMTLGLTHTHIDLLREAAHVAMPGYQVRSDAPVVGRLIAWLRRNLTSHLREPYLDPIIARQEAYNQLLLDTLLPALERSLRTQQRLERQLRLLQQHLAQASATGAEAGEPIEPPGGG